jgi:hypothetical protein
MVDPGYIEQFKADLQHLSASEIFEQYIAVEECAGFPELNQTGLRQRVADHFGISADQVVVVGSAKVGFCLTDKRVKDGEGPRPAFSPFDDQSDVDLAIVSDGLFDDIWKRSFEFWHTSGYAQGWGYWSSGKDFRNYIFRGWMRPDKLPSEGLFRYKDEWFDFFRLLVSERAAGDYRITAGLYRESYFLQAYQSIAISACKARVSAQP